MTVAMDVLIPLFQKDSACDSNGDDTSNPLNQYVSPRSTAQQTVISVVLGLSAFLAFCFLRPRWTGLYAARKKQKNAASGLPDLPPTFFGWIPVLYRITEEEVLASAGLDAFVFLRFFKMAIKYLSFVFFFVLTVIYPVHQVYNGDEIVKKPGNHTDNALISRRENSTFQTPGNSTLKPPKDEYDIGFEPDYLWIYVVFAYVFSAFAVYLIITETNHVIRVRQKYLSTHSSVTDRTIRLSGIPPDLRTEQKIKETVEDLQIGKVESVTLCRDWKELDDLIDERMAVLRKLEEAWTVHLGSQRTTRILEHPRVQRQSQIREGDGDEQNPWEESDGLLPNMNGDGQQHITTVSEVRPMTRIWYGFWNLQSRKIDAIDYYEETLRRLDERIKATRLKEFAPTPLAFVTLDSIAACQMAIQAIIDPGPMQLIANPAPAPEDVVWRNTYLSRRRRMTKAWLITVFVLALTVVWWVIFVPVAGLLNLETIGRVSPQFRDFLCQHEGLSGLVKTTVPTLILSLMLVLVPYLYDWLSRFQGMTSQGDAEMSVISKNFFFTFFNIFVSFTIFGTASNAYQEHFWETLKKFGPIVLARALATLSSFYTNLIVLQAIGLSPFRLLEFGAVSLYPIGLIGSKTPRDYAELMHPPVFSYGFYLPQILFIYLICMVYSVLPGAEWMLLFGIIYFMTGAFIYKYQLLYAMDHRHFSTGRAWVMICNRITVGLLVFQVTMACQLAFKTAVRRSLLIIPLLGATAWFIIVYRRTYEPLMRFIALRSLRDAQVAPTSAGSQNEDEVLSIGASDRTRDGSDCSTAYVNPSLVMPLEDVWLSKHHAQRASISINGGGLADGGGQDV